MNSTPMSATNRATVAAHPLHDAMDFVVRQEAPRRFAVCALNYSEEDGVVLVWGQEFGDGSVEIAPDQLRIRGSFQSAESAVRHIRRAIRHPLRLIWVDPPVELDKAA